MKIGFIGLGIMGSRMAANLLKNNYELLIYNRTQAKADILISKGAKLLDTPAAVASASDVLITMLSTPEAVIETAKGENGFLHSMKNNAIWIDSSTVNPSFSLQMEQKAKAYKIKFLDAPVAGSKDPAEKGELTFLVGGDKENLDQVRELFEIMGKKIIHLGPPGSGTSMKMIINMMLGQSMAAFSEAMTLGRKLGFKDEELMDVLLDGPAVAPFLSAKKEKFEHDDYGTEFPLKWMYKDLYLAAMTAYENNLAMPFLNAGKELYAQAKSNGYAEKDFSALFQYLKNIDEKE